MSPTARACGGFSLLEVLVALSILAMSYAAILQILGGSANRAARSSEYRQAMIVAESRLDYAAASITGRRVESSGVASDRYHWALSYAPADDYSVEGLPARYTPVTITVRVTWISSIGRERALELSTIRLTRAGA